jgi:hypothetical protein
VTQPSRFEISEQQIEVNRAGIALCREAIAPVLAARIRPEPSKPLTKSEEIHQRALERAMRERRNQRIRGIESAGEIFERLPIRAAPVLTGAAA